MLARKGYEESLSKQKDEEAAAPCSLQAMSRFKRVTFYSVLNFF